jgi:hypothetical protein
MIKRILLLKFVSWVVLSPVFALAPIQPVRISGEPHFSDHLRKWDLRTALPTGLIGPRRACCASSRVCSSR